MYIHICIYVYEYVCTYAYTYIHIQVRIQGLGSAKETYSYRKRDLGVPQKRPTYMAKETYPHLNSTQLN